MSRQGPQGPGKAWEAVDGAPHYQTKPAFVLVILHHPVAPQSGIRGVHGALSQGAAGRSKATIEWANGAMIGAVLYFVGGGGRLKRVTGGRADPDDIQAATEHIVAFVLAGLRGL